MDNNFDLENKTENKSQNGFGNTYSEYQPPQTKDEFRINAAIPPKTFNKLVIGAVVLTAVGSIAGLIALIIHIMRLF